MNFFLGVNVERRYRLLKIVLFLALALGVAIETTQVTKYSNEFHARARILIGWKEWAHLDDVLAKFLGTVIETVECEEMARRAHARMRVLHPDLQPAEVRVEAKQQPMAGEMFVVTAHGISAEYTVPFLNALLAEVRSFGMELHERHLSSTHRWLDQQERVLKDLDNQIARARESKPQDDAVVVDLERRRKTAREQVERENQVLSIREEADPVAVVDRAKLVSILDQPHGGGIAAIFCAVLLAVLAWLQKRKPAAPNRSIG